MKRLFSVILLLVFACTSILKLGVVVNYMIQFDFYSKVLCVNKDIPESNCHGQCQLNKEISSIDGPVPNQTVPIPSETETSFQFIGILLNGGVEHICTGSEITILNQGEVNPFLYQSPLDEIPTPPPQLQLS